MQPWPTRECRAARHRRLYLVAIPLALLLAHGVPFRDIAGVIGRRAECFGRRQVREEAAADFGFLGRFAGLDCCATQQVNANPYAY